MNNLEALVERSVMHLGSDIKNNQITMEMQQNVKKKLLKQQLNTVLSKYELVDSASQLALLYNTFYHVWLLQRQLIFLWLLY